jgi:high-affinity Fe2+/Pb2+ permease
LNHQALEKAAADESASVSHRSHAWSVFILAASAVLREGIESIVFLAGACVFDQMFDQTYMC